MIGRFLTILAIVAALAGPALMPTPALAHGLGKPDQVKEYPGGISTQEFMRGEKPRRIKLVCVVLPDQSVNLVIMIFETPPILRVAEMQAKVLLAEFKAIPLRGYQINRDGYVTAYAMGPAGALLELGFMPEELPEGVV